MTMTRQSTTQVAQVRSDDPHDCASTGWLLTLYSDGSVAAEYTTCWQGSRSTVRYRSDPGLIDVDDLDPEDEDHDAEAALTKLLRRLLAVHANRRDSAIPRVEGA